MKITSEKEMLEFGKNFGKNLHAPLSIELVGDVGVGKTTFVRGMAEGLGVKESVTSPSFTISRQYAFSDNKRLIHYDFYRLPDPGLMSEDLSEATTDENAIVVVEWADSVAKILPENTIKIEIRYNDDGSREIKL